MYRVVLWTLCLFVLAPSANAQLPKGAPYAWGIVPPAHQDLQVYDRDPDAHAVVLSDFGKWEFKKRSKELGFVAVLERHVRIKILSEAGLDQADQEIRFIGEDKIEKVNHFEAQTINFVN
ncbi:MAG: hypothetical protein AAFQ68_27935, partial [Bacteroidota bacterium]